MELVMAKGAVFSTAVVAGVMAAKRTSDLIPFCHPIALEDCQITITTRPPREPRTPPPGAAPSPASDAATTGVVAAVGTAGGWVEALVECRVVVSNKTGVEMEALVGCSVAALTVYDMCKAASHDIEIGRLRVVSKTGGKSDYRAPSPH